MPRSNRQSQLPGMEDGPATPAETAQPAPASGPSDPPLGAAAAAALGQDSLLLPPADWTVYAVDAHSLIFQVFHAMAGSDLSTPQGEPVGAVYGFTRDLVQMMEKERPTALLCAFDLPGPTFRNELYDAYKADRGEMPADLASQIPKIRDVVAALGIPIIAAPGFEADDVLAAIARMCDESGATCRLVTGDKDCRQLISDHVSVYNLRKLLNYDAAALAEDWGIRPDQVCDFQALVGDKVDNIPGVPLIGPKLAKELLEKYGTLQQVLDNAESVSGKKRSQNLIDYREQALLSRKLVELDRYTPVTLDWRTAEVGNCDRARLEQLFRDFGFRGLAERALAVAGNADDGSASSSFSGANGDSNWQAEYQIVDTPEALDRLVAQLAGQPRISLDTETTSVDPRRAEIVGYALAWKPGEAYYVPVRGPEGDRMLDPVATANALRPMLEDPAIEKIGQNLKYDLVALRSAGIYVRGVAFDTMVASYLLDAGERSHNLDHLARVYLGHETTKIESLIGSGKKQIRMDEAPVADVGPYAAEDADVPLRLLPLLEDRLESDGLAELNEKVETPLIEVLAELEYTGVCVDVERLAELSRDYTARLQTLREEIEEIAGRPLNIDSPKQLAELLFQDLGLPVVKKTKTGASTDASVLEALAPLHPLPAKIVEYRQYAKLLSTYIDALPQLVHPDTGRIHASLNQVVAATGRLSSSNPNLQNIPIRTREGREIRSAFKAGEPDWLLLAADYSQIELRVLAHFSGDPTLRDAFANDEDIHRLVASQVHDVSLDEVTADMRRGAKAVNFGIIYGQSPFGLAKSLGIAKEEAAEFIDTYFARYPGVMGFMVDTLEKCRRQGYVTTLLGRRRAIAGVRPTPEGLRESSGALRQLNLPERTAVNTVIQGSAADLIKLAMLRVHEALADRGDKPRGSTDVGINETTRSATSRGVHPRGPGVHQARMLLQIHDELLFETPAGEVAALGELVSREMSGVGNLSVPLRVDVKAGPTWAECEAM